MKTTCTLCNHDADAGLACGFCGLPLPSVAGAPATGPNPSPPPAGEALPVGTPLDQGLYHVGTVLGQGGFGITYAGSDSRLRRVVAIKELFPAGCARVGLEIRSTKEFSENLYLAVKARFLEEARVVARFQHPGIVHVHGFFEENATAYMVMEMVGGETLQSRVERSGPLPEDEALACIRQVGDALEVVHAAGYLHRDLKPDNLLLASNGHVVLLDFGTARQYAQHARRMTAMVTPGYAPPEQYTGQEQSGPASDVYALAATLYYLLTGTVPAEAVERATGRQTLIPLHTLLPSVSQATCRAVTRALALDEATRPRDAQAFLADLQGPCVSAAPGMAAIARPAPPGGPAHAPGTTADAPAPPCVPSPAAVVATWNAAGDAPAPPCVPSPAAVVATSNAAAHVPGPPCVPSPGAAGPVPTGVDAATARASAQAGATTIALPPGGAETVRADRADAVPRRLEDITPTIAAKMESHRGWIRALAYAPDGNLLASGAEDRTIRLWNAQGAERACLLGHEAWVSAVAFAPDSRRLASGSHDRTVCVWDASTGACLRTVKARDRVCSVAFSPDGSLLVAGLASGSVQVFPSEAPGPDRIFRHGDASVVSLAFTPDGRRLVMAAGVDSGISIFDVSTGTRLGRLEGHQGTVRAVTVDSAGLRVLSGSSDSTVRIWDLEARRELTRLAGHHGPVMAVAFSPLHDLAASASQDHTIRLWQPSRAAELRSLQGHKGEVSSVAFSPDGLMMATASQDQAILLWSLWP